MLDAGYTSHDSRDLKSQLMSVFIGQAGGSSHELDPLVARIKLLRHFHYLVAPLLHSSIPIFILKHFYWKV